MTSSRTEVMNLFRDLAGVGQSVMDDMENVRVNTLLAFEQYLSQANMLRTRVDRILGDGVLGRFVISDFNGVDISHTTASVRPDIGAATLKERGKFVASPVEEVRFSADRGTYQQLANTYRVMSPEGIPTGTFEIEYVSPIMGNLVVFDLVTPSADVVVSVAGVGLDMQPFGALSVSRNGYRVSAWLPSREMRALRIAITPSRPDIAGGLGYTFGVTDLNSRSLAYHMAGELAFKPITVRPRGPKARFRAAETEGLSYFLSFNGVEFHEVQPDETITLPNCGSVATAQIGLDVAGKLAHTLLADFHATTLRAADASGKQAPLLFGLKAGQTPSSQCLSVSGTDLHLTPFAVEDAGKTFSLQYSHGPDTLPIWLKVRFASATNILTPVFTGAHLEKIV